MRKKVVFLSFVFGLLIALFISMGSQAVAEQPEDVLEKALTSHPISDSISRSNDAEDAETYTREGSEGTTSPKKEVKIWLEDNLNAFLSFGAPAVRDLSGEEEDMDYRATVGINIPL